MISLLSWSRGVGLGQFPTAGVALLIHLAFHAVYGAVAALPTRRRGAIAAMAAAAVMIDVDHVAYYLGWPVPPRTSHSLFFLVFWPMLMALAARMGLLGRDVSPRAAAGMAIGVVLAHLAWDAVTGGGETRVPFWLPFSAQPLTLSAPIGGLLEIAAVAVVWLTASAEAARAHWRLPRIWPA